MATPESDARHTDGSPAVRCRGMPWKLLFAVGLGAWSAHVLFGDVPLPELPSAEEALAANDPVVLCVFPGEAPEDTFLRHEACLARGGREGASSWARGS